jgi:hypothetical protein
MIISSLTVPPPGTRVAGLTQAIPGSNVFSYRKHLLRFSELWYDEPHPGGGTDILVFNQAPEPRPGLLWREKKTLVLDLAQSQERLQADLRKTYRAEIRTARDRDHLRCSLDLAPDPALRSRFYDFYDRFAQTKGLEPLERPLLEQMALRGALALSQAGLEGEACPLVCHAYLVYGGRARSLYSASLRLAERDPGRLSLMGRANRLLHWEDILRFRAEGLGLYDFGGWYGGTEDRQRLAINRFKEGFGGRRITEYDAIQGVTLLGRMGVALRHLLKGH